MKIFIIGGAGSGKTTLARALAARTGAPMLELDIIAWTQGGRGGPTSPEERRAAIDAVMQHDSWVVEGVYLGWTDGLARSADAVVWLDVPARVALWRIFWRHLKADLARNNRHPGWRKLYRFMRCVRCYYTDGRVVDTFEDSLTRATTALAMPAHGGRLLHVTRPITADEVLEFIRRRAVPS